MAELQQQENRKQQGVRRSKKLSTKVDLTPMVDLGFLLITFFIFTTSMSQPMVTKLVMPSDEKVDTPSTAAASKTISFILSGNDKIVFYNGNDMDKATTTDYTANGIRHIILQKQNAVAAKFGDAKEMVLLIKPTEQSSYANLVAVLDEIQINDVKKYVLMDADENEKKLAVQDFKSGQF